tara:strand:+ start:4084 stop:6216 length:2133 start_codon:yes stop_codon:yes gene_type:complete
MGDYFWKKIPHFCLVLFLVTSNCIHANSYNSFGQVGLISIPSAEVKAEPSIFFTSNKNNYIKLGTLTVTPFDWMEASYFYYRPDDLLWGGTKGLFLDKGFNVKFSYKPKSIFIPRLAIGLDDFAGTGNFTKEYVVSTYDLKGIKLTAGIGWGKFVGDVLNTKNPLSYISDDFNIRPSTSGNYALGGNPSYDKWFRGNSALFGGIEFSIPKTKNMKFKIETDPFDYFKFSCCGEGLSNDSYRVRNKIKNYNYGISYQFNDYGNIDMSYIKGDTWNLSFSFGLSSDKPLRKKNKFKPNIVNKNFNQTVKREFYYDLLDNLNNNSLYLQTASISKNQLSITVDSQEFNNPISYSSRAAHIANEVAKFNNYNFRKIDVGLITRGIEINNIAFRPEDIENKKLPLILQRDRAEISYPKNLSYKNDEFQPRLKFPILINSFEPDIRMHIGSPERFAFTGIGIKMNSEIQLNRNLTISSSIGQSLDDNFDRKFPCPCTLMEPVRTEVVSYLQESDDLYIKHLQIDNIWAPKENFYARITAGYLEDMFAGISTELLYKPFNRNIAISIENNYVQKRNYNGRFKLLDYRTNTNHLNLSFYEPNTNILVKWSYGKYLAKDKGYTLDLSRRMPAGWQAGVYFSKTNVSAEIFGEGSFDKGFYFKIPFNIFIKGNTKASTGFSLKTMTRDGGAKLNLQNKLIDSFYGSTLSEINENWKGFLK